MLKMLNECGYMSACIDCQGQACEHLSETNSTNRTSTLLFQDLLDSRQRIGGHTTTVRRMIISRTVSIKAI